MSLAKEHQRHYDGGADPRCIVQGDKYRFSVLTDEMLRMEYSPDGVFEDRPTQVVTNRKFPVPDFNVIDKDGRLEISTRAFHLVYNKKEFTPNNLYIDLKGAYTNYGGRWLFGAVEYGNPPREHNLKGTARTLDQADGAVKLDFGLVDRSGRTFFDDSFSLTLSEEGWPEERKTGIKDFYYLGYGHDYYKAVHDFYLLSGRVPLLPRYALGNWWSRYWKYTEESYMDLLARFEKEDVPFSVGVLDMDWHLVDIPEKYGRGWTGFTWNKELFPDPEAFISKVHGKGLKVTMNIHPADGVMPHEEAYEAMCAALGRDSKSDEPVLFDITDQDFLSAYFRLLHHPHEEAGVDFWWIDWQQGTSSAIPGLDPLRMLNHFYFLDLERDRTKRGLILSRYGGLGSHRYPVGFSGDTIISWESLDFQPYFTATASNIGYTWWSHDIGGHMRGIKDNELVIRWIQFGVFSPVNRLHSSNNVFFNKEPWHFKEPYRSVFDEFLRLRHKLVPYIYSMNWRVHEDLVPFIVPMYYDYPEAEEAYERKNQYMFGSELMVAPITGPSDKSTLSGSVAGWIPPGDWIDFFDGAVYHGGKKGRSLMLSRTIDKCPVFAKAGGIVPMSRKAENELRNPEEMDILIFAGADGTFTLYEDEGDGFGYESGKAVRTTMTQSFSDGCCAFTLSPEGDFSVLPGKRYYRLLFRGLSDGAKVLSSTAAVLSSSYDFSTHTFQVSLAPLSPSEAVEVSLSDAVLYHNEDISSLVLDALLPMQMENMQKSEILALVSSDASLSGKLGSLDALSAPREVKTVIYEMLSR